MWTSKKHEDTSITFTAKKEATWEQMNAWLETVYGKNGKDKHWKWMGFGEVGTDTFKVVLVRRPCSKWICKCESCVMCGGDTGYDAVDNEDGTYTCFECIRQEESGEE
jgi:hypothetical protein